jgi:hypothetical protein
MKLAYFFTLIIVLMCERESAFAQTLPRTPTGNWVISETNSPVDYTPVVVAVARSLAKDEPSALELSISCRNGRTNLILAGAAIPSRGTDYSVSYRIRDNPIELNVKSAAVGPGVAVQGDVVRLLQSFPGVGRMTIRIVFRSGTARETDFLLDGLDVVRIKVAGACNWPKVGD